MGGNEDRPTYDLADFAGGSKYWYVDPRAGNQSQQAWQPSGRIQQPDAESQREYDNLPQSMLDRLLYEQSQNLTLRKARTDQLQERADPFDRIRYKGMLEPASTDNEVAEATGTFQIGKETYILPTKINGVNLSKEQAIQRLMDTGEHLGIFETLKDAMFHERHYLQP